MKLGEIIRQARVAVGMSQRELAEHLGTHHAAVGAWELDQNHPDVENKIGLSAVLGIPFTDLLDLYPEVEERVEVVTDPQMLAIVRLIGREPPERRAALLRAVALLLERLNRPAPAVRPAPKRRTEKAT